MNKKNLINVIYVVIALFCLILFTFFMVSFSTNNIHDQCNIDCSDRGSSWKQQDGKCECICADNWTGENCEKCAPGYYQVNRFSYTNKRTETVCKKCETCDETKGIVETSLCENGRNSICMKCGDGKFASEGQCNTCTNCDEQPNKRFDKPCQLNADSVCVDNTCNEGEYFNSSTGSCTACTTCIDTEKQLSECTFSYNRKCVETCPDGYFSENGKCIKCQSCNSTQIETLQCTNYHDRVCLDCAYDEYPKNNTCHPNICNDFQYMDLECLEMNKDKDDSQIKDTCCKLCTICDTPTNNIYINSCSASEDSKCGHECPSDEYFIDEVTTRTGEKVNQCIKCSSCSYNEIAIQECSDDSNNKTTKNVKDRICIPTGKVPYPYSEQLCPSCFPETTNTSYFSDFTQYNKCETSRVCTDASKSKVCAVSSAFTGNCVNGLCEVIDSQYCSTSSDGGLVGSSICNENGNYPKIYEDGTEIPKSDLLLNGDCGSNKSTFYYNKSDPTQVIFIPEDHNSPLNDHTIPSFEPSPAVATFNGQTYTTPEGVSYGDGCFVYSSVGKYDNTPCSDTNKCPDGYECNNDGYCKITNQKPVIITDPSSIDYDCVFNPSEFSILQQQWCSSDPVDPKCINDDNNDELMDVDSNLKILCGRDDNDVPVSCMINSDGTHLKYKP